MESLDIEFFLKYINLAPDPKKHHIPYLNFSQATSHTYSIQTLTF